MQSPGRAGRPAGEPKISAGPVGREHEVGAPDRDFPARVQRMLYGDAEINTELRRLFDGFLRGAELRAVFLEVSDGRIIRRERLL